MLPFAISAIAELLAATSPPRTAESALAN
jgi:hypothetical protein